MNNSTYVFQLHDIHGTPLADGDLVKVSTNNSQVVFYSEVKYLEEENAFAPFHTFAFHAVEKVDSVPDDAEPTMSEERYKVWYVRRDGESDEYGSEYITSWRECEYLLRRCFSIKKVCGDAN